MEGQSNTQRRQTETQDYLLEKLKKNNAESRYKNSGIRIFLKGGYDYRNSEKRTRVEGNSPTGKGSPFHKQLVRTFLKFSSDAMYKWGKQIIVCKSTWKRNLVQKIGIKIGK